MSNQKFESLTYNVISNPNCMLDINHFLIFTYLVRYTLHLKQLKKLFLHMT